MRRTAFVLFLLCLPLPGRAEEWLLLRDGGQRTGQLQSCVQDQCRLSGQTIPRSSIAWIGFNGRKDSPPAVQDPARDAVYLLDESVHAGRVVGISLGEVTMEDTGYPRSSVAWVWFAGQAPAGGTAPSPPPPPPSGPGAFWTGTITGRYWGTVDGIYSELTVAVSARLREVKTSPILRIGDREAKTVGSLVHLEPEGTVVTVQFHSSGQYLSCSGTGATTITATLDDSRFGHPSVIYKKTVDVNLTPTLGFDVPLGAGALYQVGLTTPEQFTYTCVSGGVSSDIQAGYIIPMLGRTPLLPPGIHVDPQLRYLQDGGGRMKGNYTTSSTGAYEQLEASWDLTRSERR